MWILAVNMYTCKNITLTSGQVGGSIIRIFACNYIMGFIWIISGDNAVYDHNLRNYYL